MRALSDVPGTYTRNALIMGAAGLLTAVLITIVAGASSDTIVFTVVLTLSLEMVLGALAALVVVFRGEMIHSAQFTMAATTKYAQQWRDVYGVYEYIRVSGMDIFTPHYETMDFVGLDPLYPYAVAAGLDKKVIKLIV